VTKKLTMPAAISCWYYWYI